MKYQVKVLSDEDAKKKLDEFVKNTYILRIELKVTSVQLNCHMEFNAKKWYLSGSVSDGFRASVN